MEISLLCGQLSTRIPRRLLQSAVTVLVQSWKASLPAPDLRTRLSSGRLFVQNTAGKECARAEEGNERQSLLLN